MPDYKAKLILTRPAKQSHNLKLLIGGDMEKIKAFFINLRNKILGTSWKTTATGYGSAIAYGLVSWLQSDSLRLKDFLIALTIAVLGKLAKDFDQTGLPEKD
jgi:hypothetical protein